jgi:predicted nucleic acid-binding protein
MLNRPALATALSKSLSRSRAVVLVGPQQVDKTTLAKQWLKLGHPNYFDLEAIDDRVRLLMDLNSGLRAGDALHAAVCKLNDITLATTDRQCVRALKKLQVKCLRI